MNFMIEHQKSDYEILLKQDAVKKEKIAAEELQAFLKASTGVELPIVQEKTDGKKYIYIDVAPAGYEDDVKKLNDSGFRILSVDGEYYVFGKTANGTLYGTYELLTRLIDFEPVCAEETYYQKKDALEFVDLDILDNPDIEYRKMSYYKISKNDLYSYRFRNMTGDLSEEVMPIVGDEFFNGFFSTLFCHTTFKLVPPERDEKGNLIHPDWYNEKVNQLCWTNDEARAALIKNLKKWILEWPEGKVFLVGIEDNGQCCHCPRCEEEYKKYTTSGVHIRFINKIADEIEAWRKETMPEREFLLAAFAYLTAVKNPPVVKDEKTGEYKPIHESLRLRDNVAIFNAIIDACGYHSLESRCNSDVRERFEKWAAISKHMMVWDYHAYFDNYFLPMPDWRQFADNVKHYVSYHTKLLYSEGNVYGYAIGFHDMKTYLFTKLSWNCSLDTEALINRFFKLYYKESAKEMREYLAMLENHYKKLEKDYAKYGPRGYHVAYNVMGHPDVLTERHWDKKFLLKAKKKLESALATAAKIPEEDTRVRVERRVETELCCIEYLLIELHTYYESETTMEEMITRFKERCARCGLIRGQHWVEGKRLTQVIGEWHWRYPARDDKE